MPSLTASVKRLALQGAIALAAALAAAGPALAQSTACLRLANELAAIDSGGGFNGPASPRYRQYEAAIRDQKAQIGKTQRAARQNGCATGSRSNICRRIAGSLAQMNSNLRELEQTLRQLAPRKGGAARQRLAIVAEMDRNGCQIRVRGTEASLRAEPRRRSLLEQIFGVRTYTADGGRSTGYQYEPDNSLTSRYGTFRTLCVRTCDGYYFPISFSTVPDRFAEDEATCEAMCPGQNVELFFHAMPAQDSEDMISYRTDEPYASMSTAFNYRKEVKEECACRQARRSNITEIAGTGGITEVDTAARARSVSTPVWRVDPGLDPETASNAGSRFTIADVERFALRGEAVGAEANRPRNVRVVGPSFFPVQ